MIYVQMYHLSTGYVKGSMPPRFDEKLKKPIEACGSENVVVLDARLKLSRLKQQADSLLSSPKFHRACGYRLMRGSSFTNAKPISEYVAKQ